MRPAPHSTSPGSTFPRPVHPSTVPAPLHRAPKRTPRQRKVGVRMERPSGGLPKDKKVAACMNEGDIVSLSTKGDADPLGRTGVPGVMAPGFVSVEEPEPPGHIRTTKVCPPSKEKNAPCKGGPTLAAGYSRNTSDCPSQGGATDLRHPHSWEGARASDLAQSKPNLGPTQEELRGNGTSRPSMAARHTGGGGQQQGVDHRSPARAHLHGSLQGLPGPHGG